MSLMTAVATKRHWVHQLLVAAALAPSPAAAQWQVLNMATEGERGFGEVAAVRNATGHSLRVYRDANGVVYGEFLLRSGFHTLARSTCPSYQIDLKRPVALYSGRNWCELSDRSARFVLGQSGTGRVESATLRDLMNGTRLRFRFHLTGLGYQETEFSLRGSKQALNEAIGADVPQGEQGQADPPVTTGPLDLED